MEEQKSKEVKLHPETRNTEKLSYEKLNEIAGQLFNENNALKQRLQQAAAALNAFNRLDYLFKVVDAFNNKKVGSLSFKESFVEDCIGEIQELMTIPVDEGNKETGKE